jgi:hypothetical protein
MPIYSFRKKGQRKTFDIEMKIAELDEYTKANPDHIRVFKPIGTIDPVHAGRAKPPDDFSKYVLGRIKQAHPRGNVERKTGPIKKEI